MSNEIINTLIKEAHEKAERLTRERGFYSGAGVHMETEHGTVEVDLVPKQSRTGAGPWRRGKIFRLNGKVIARAKLEQILG